MVHLPHLLPGPQHSNGSQHPASGLLCTSKLELKTENTLSYIGIGIRMIPVGEEVSDWSGMTCSGLD